MDEIGLKELAKFSVNKFVAEGYEFTEEKIHVIEHPSILIQCLAWNGVAYREDGSLVRVKGWESLPDHVLGQLGAVLLTTYQSVLNGKNRPNEDGSYDLLSVSGTSKVEEGGLVSVPDYEQAKKRATGFTSYSYF